ncbi:hypothetical protein C8R43DRAFT_419167 [Mycena crocata]|nr:hypothetical protein C8R43DRAFT_419167 [Mycena crocata]
MRWVSICIQLHTLHLLLADGSGGENPYICASCDVPPDPNAMKKTGNIASMKTKTPKKENRGKFHTLTPAHLIDLHLLWPPVTVAPRLKKSLGKEKKKLKMLASEFDRSPLAPVRQAQCVRKSSGTVQELICTATRTLS